MNSGPLGRRAIQGVVCGFIIGIFLVGCATSNPPPPSPISSGEQREMQSPNPAPSRTPQIAATKESLLPTPTEELSTEPELILDPTSLAEATATTDSISESGMLPGFGSFSMASANTQRPSDILEIVSFFAGGAGFPCSGETALTLLYDGRDSYELIPYSATQNAHEDIFITSCGWTYPGPLQVTIDFPDGTKSFDAVETVSDPTFGTLAAYYSPDLGLDPPAGVYRVTLSNSAEAITDEFLLERPISPRLFRLADGSLLLWNFVPGESVMIIAYSELEGSLYERQGEFMGFQEYQIGPDGSLFIEVTGPANAFAAIGEFTGEIVEGPPFSQIVLPIRQ